MRYCIYTPEGKIYTRRAKVARDWRDKGCLVRLVHQG